MSYRFPRNPIALLALLALGHLGSCSEPEPTEIVVELLRATADKVQSPTSSEHPSLDQDFESLKEHREAWGEILEDPDLPNLCMERVRRKQIEQGKYDDIDHPLTRAVRGGFALSILFKGGFSKKRVARLLGPVVGMVEEAAGYHEDKKKIKALREKSTRRDLATQEVSRRLLRLLEHYPAEVRTQLNSFQFDHEEVRLTSKDADGADLLEQLLDGAKALVASIRGEHHVPEDLPKCSDLVLLQHAELMPLSDAAIAIEWHYPGGDNHHTLHFIDTWRYDEPLPIAVFSFDTLVSLDLHIISRTHHLKQSYPGKRGDSLEAKTSMKRAQGHLLKCEYQEAGEYLKRMAQLGSSAEGDALRARVDESSRIASQMEDLETRGLRQPSSRESLEKLVVEAEDCLQQLVQAEDLQLCNEDAFRKSRDRAVDWLALDARFRSNLSKVDDGSSGELNLHGVILLIKTARDAWSALPAPIREQESLYLECRAGLMGLLGETLDSELDPVGLLSQEMTLAALLDQDSGKDLLAVADAHCRSTCEVISEAVSEGADWTELAPYAQFLGSVSADGDSLTTAAYFSPAGPLLSARCKDLLGRNLKGAHGPVEASVGNQGNLPVFGGCGAQMAVLRDYGVSFSGLPASPVRSDLIQAARSSMGYLNGAINTLSDDLELLDFLQVALEDSALPGSRKDPLSSFGIVEGVIADSLQVALDRFHESALALTSPGKQAKLLKRLAEFASWLDGGTGEYYSSPSPLQNWSLQLIQGLTNQYYRDVAELVARGQRALEDGNPLKAKQIAKEIRKKTSKGTSFRLEGELIAALAIIDTGDLSAMETADQALGEITKGSPDRVPAANRDVWLRARYALVEVYADRVELRKRKYLPEAVASSDAYRLSKVKGDITKEIGEAIQMIDGYLEYSNEWGLDPRDGVRLKNRLKRLQ